MLALQILFELRCFGLDWSTFVKKVTKHKNFDSFIVTFKSLDISAGSSNCCDTFDPATNSSFIADNDTKCSFLHGQLIGIPYKRNAVPIYCISIRHPPRNLHLKTFLKWFSGLVHTLRLENFILFVMPKNLLMGPIFWKESLISLFSLSNVDSIL